MKPREFFIGRTIGLIVVLVIAAAVAMFFAFKKDPMMVGDGVPDATEPYQTTLTGQYVCLPHTNQNGPQTEECAAGIRVAIAQGVYYALDFNAMSQSMPSISAGDTITANGIVTPASMLSSNQWQNYPIKGVFSVTDSLQVNPVPTFVWKFEKAQSLNLDGQPNTEVYLEATYPSKQVLRKLIATVPGGCSILPDKDVRSVPNSNTAQCYSAGLGYTFRVIKGEDSYSVQRKTFEEALPDTPSQNYEYETVSDFQFTY